MAEGSIVSEVEYSGHSSYIPRKAIHMRWFNVQLIFVSSCVYVNVLMMN